MIGDAALRTYRMAFPTSYCERVHFGIDGRMLDNTVLWDGKGAWPLHCPECGCMIVLDFCAGCFQYFIRFGPGGDDILREAGVTPEGDLMCAECAADAEAHEYDDEYDEGFEEEFD